MLVHFFMQSFAPFTAANMKVRFWILMKGNFCHYSVDTLAAIKLRSFNNQTRSHMTSINSRSHDKNETNNRARHAIKAFVSDTNKLNEFEGLIKSETCLFP